MLKFKNKSIYLLIFVILVLFFIFFIKKSILLQIGDFLEFVERPEKADVIVLIRGGKLDRTIQVAELYKKQFGDKVLVPTALGDDVSNQFIQFNLKLSNGQERIKSLLQQLDIPEENIILSTHNPGGGTVGEAYRVKKDLLDLGVQRCVIVTSWYHTKRVNNIYNEIFSDTDIKFWVVASKYGESNSGNWWHYRYITRAVLFEVPRLCISYLNPTFNFSFHDDPGNVD